MKKKAIKLTIILSLLLFITFILFNNLQVQSTVLKSINVWLTKVFPSLFPMFVLSDLLLAYGFADFLARLCDPITKRLFKITGKASYVFIMSLLSGTPSNAYMVKTLYQNKELSKNECTKVLCFSFFANPIFLMTMLSLIFNDDIALILKIIFIHYSTNMIIGILLRNKYPSTFCIAQHSSKKIPDFGLVLSNSIKKAMGTLTMILGTITFFFLVSATLGKALTLPLLPDTILSGILEMTQGLNALPLLFTSKKTKAILALIFISFGGFSIHTQVKSILSETDIAYRPFFWSRILHATLAACAGIFL